MSFINRSHARENALIFMDALETLKQSQIQDDINKSQEKIKHVKKQLLNNIEFYNAL